MLSDGGGEWLVWLALVLAAAIAGGVLCDTAYRRGEVLGDDDDGVCPHCGKALEEEVELDCGGCVWSESEAGAF